MACEQRCDFAGSYERSYLPAVKALERDVLGCDYGGTSWTTRDQASNIMSSLALNSSSSLLEVGCGAGWPGLYLSSMTGCDVTLLDMPLIALEQAAERAARDDIAKQVRLVNGSGTALPFAAESFDCISHSDVLCCLPDKLEMLKECRRVVTTGGRMHFSAIRPSEGLSPADHQRAVETGPPFVDVPEGYGRLLQESGWRVADRVDISAEYGSSLEKLVAGLKRNTPALREAYGADELRDLWRHRAEQYDLVRLGILQRVVFSVITA